MPNYIVKLVEHYEHDGDEDWEVEEYKVSKRFFKIAEEIMNSKKTFYVEATPEECQELKLEHLDWDFDRNCLITEDIDSLTSEAASAGCRVTFDEDDNLKILVPVSETASAIGAKHKSKMQSDAFKQMLDDPEVRRHLSKYMQELLDQQMEDEGVVDRDDLERFPEVVEE